MHCSISDSAAHGVVLRGTGHRGDLHVLLGEMVPKNIAIAGPESAAMLLIPPYLVYIGRPGRSSRSTTGAALTLRAFRVEPRDELESAVSDRAVRDDHESRCPGLLDTEAQPADPAGAADPQQDRRRCRHAPLDQIHVIPVAPGSGPTVGAVERSPRRAIRASSGGRVRRAFIRYLHIKDVLPQVEDPDAVLDVAMVRPLPRLAASLRCPTRCHGCSADNSHLALAARTRQRRDRDGRTGGSGRGSRPGPCATCAPHLSSAANQSAEALPAYAVAGAREDRNRGQ